MLDRREGGLGKAQATATIFLNYVARLLWRSRPAL